MTAYPIPNPFSQWNDVTGLPLSSGYIYIGEPSQDPVTHPIAVYQDAGLTIAYLQPLRTTGGFLVGSGTPANAYPSSTPYSISVRNSANVQIYYEAVVHDEIADALAAIMALLPAAAGVILATQSTTYPAGTLGNHYNQEVFVTDAPWNAKCDGATNDTVALNACIAAAPAHAKVIIPASLTIGTISVRRNDITLCMAGVTLKTPAGVDGITLELGNTAAGNAAPAYTNVNVLGYPTIDGNYTNTPAPATDLTGQGFSAVNVSNSVFQFKAQNTHNACALLAINANWNRVDAEVSHGGNTVIFGAHYPNFDFNSSKHNIANIRSSGGYYGVRVLDNSWDNVVDATIENASLQAFVYNNQLVNESHCNTINVTVEGGCADYGMTIGANCRSSPITLSTSGITGTALRTLAQVSADNNPTGNHIKVVSRNSGLGSCIIEANGNTWDINSTLDGRSGIVGASWAVDVLGNDNIIKLQISDSATAHVRGIKFETGALRNQLISYVGGAQTVQPIVDSGTNNRYQLSGSATYDPPSLASGAGATTTVTVSGAKLGMPAFAGFSTDVQGIVLSASVQSADVVAVRFYNETGGTVDLASGTLTAIVQAA